MYEVAIIGAGVVGGAIARELSRFDFKIVILERENDVCVGTSKANSGIVHAGYDSEENTLMAKLSVEGNTMFDDICRELSVPFKRNGSLVVAFDDEQLEHIKRLKQRGINNGVPDLAILSKEELLRQEPAISPEAKGALFAPTAGIVDPMLLTISLIENAVMNGAECLLNFDVQAIEKTNSGYKIRSENKQVDAKYVINAAGVFADKIHNMIGKPAFKIDPRRGEYFLLDKVESGIVNATVFPCPTKAGKGILIVPTVHGNVLVGPTAEDDIGRVDLSTTEEMLERASAGARLLVPKLSVWRNNIRTFAGLRAIPDKDDFIIKEVDDAPNFIDVTGIQSPGLTAAPAIGLHVASIIKIKEMDLDITAKKAFDPIVNRKLFIEMTKEGQVALVEENPLYGRVICRCENITEGDIINAINRKVGATTMDGVKRRCRAGMGRCQSGFCGPKVQEILARERNLPLEEIVLEKGSSYILTGKTK